LTIDFFKRVRVLKETGVKVMLALGGWYDSQENKYSRLVSSKAARAQFIKHAVKFLQEHDFDGLEIDWEYPRCWQVNYTGAKKKVCYTRVYVLAVH
jgi:chitinase